MASPTMIQNEQLVKGIVACTACRLAVDRGSGLAVPADVGERYNTGGLALLLEAPGAEEEKLYDTLKVEGRKEFSFGKPLVGRSGQLMDAILAQSGLSRSEVLVLNRIRCRPPRNRIDDYPDAIAQCDTWVKKELEAYDPAVVILCGNTALKSVFGATASITSYRGNVRSTSEGFPYGCRVFIPTFHPAYAARNGGISSSIGQDIIKDIRLGTEFLW